MGSVIEAPIPKHITGIYVFTVVNLLAMLCISTVEAEIIVKDIQSNETAAIYQDLQAKFGPDFPSKGLEGRLVYAEPDPQACGSIKPPPAVDGYPWILLIARGGNCQFADKVFNAQLQNYSAAIVHNYEHKEGLIPMGGGNNGSRVTIPSTFVGWKSGMDLRRFDYTHLEYIIRILEEESIDLTPYLWPFLLVMAICILMVMMFLLLKFLRDHAAKRLSRLSNKHLKKIPVRKFKKGDYYDTCAICLDEYEEGEKIRVLPCDHVYHRKCIDPWLTKNKKTCPVCKRRVIPGRDADSESGSEGEGAGAASSGRDSENTPLLSGRSAPLYSHQPLDSNSGARSGPAQQESVRSVTIAEQGAEGGLGISDRQYPGLTLASQVVSARGNIQGFDDRRDDKQERKRKRQDRNVRKKRQEEDEASHREDETASTSVVHERRGHREKRKRKKDKKRGENRSNFHDESENREDGSEINTTPGLMEAGTVQIRVDEENGSVINPGYLENQEIVTPVAGRRRETNEVV